MGGLGSSMLNGRDIVWQIAPLPRILGEASLLKKVLSRRSISRWKSRRMRKPGLRETTE
jgi:hypothetical protein